MSIIVSWKKSKTSEETFSTALANGNGSGSDKIGTILAM